MIGAAQIDPLTSASCSGPLQVGKDALTPQVPALASVLYLLDTGKVQSLALGTGCNHTMTPTALH